MLLLYVLLLLVVFAVAFWGASRLWAWRRSKHGVSKVPTDEVADRLIAVTERLEESSERLAAQIDLYVTSGDLEAESSKGQG